MADLPHSPTKVLSSSMNPEEASRAAAQFLSGDDEHKEENSGLVAVPFITPPPDTSVKLPGGGLMDADGTLHNEAVVRELTGADEEALSKADATKSMARYVQTLVKRGTESIGTYDKLTDNLLSELLIGDREMLLLAIRRATYGDEMNLTLMCPSCASAVEASFDLASEIPITQMEDPSQRVLEVKLRDGRNAKVSIPTAADQDAVLSMTNKSVPEMNSVYLARCLISIDGVPSMGKDTVLGLGVLDRRKMIEAMNQAQPGPKYGEVSLECPGCGNGFPMNIGIIELFRG